MEKLLLAFALVVACGGVNAQEDRWLMMGKRMDGVTIELDTKSVRRTGPVIRYWARYTRPEGNWSSSREETDCDTERYRTLMRVEYTKNGVPNEDPGEPTPWKPVVPETVSEMFFDYFCGG